MQLRSTPAKGRLDAQTSEAIRIARTLCILLMIFVHFWPSDYVLLSAGAPPAAQAVYVTLVEYLGRGSVPLLGLVSGLLMVISVSRGGSVRGRIASRARALLVPMVLWSGLLLAMHLGFALLSGQTGRLPHGGVLAWVNALFAVTDAPINFPLGFLRDVFLSAALGLLALRLSDGRRAPALLAMALLAFTETHGLTDIMLRPIILVFFAAGMGIGLYNAYRWQPPWALGPALLALHLGIAHLGLPWPQILESWMPQHYLMRIGMSLTLWRLVCWLSEQHLADPRSPPGRVAEATMRIEPHVFVIFCSHALVLVCLGFVAEKLGLDPSKPLFPLFFLLQWVIVVALGIALSVLGNRWMPQAFALLRGKMPPRQRAPSAPGAA